MKGFSTNSLIKDFVKGLRNFQENHENDGGLEECYNLVPADKGLKVYDPLTSLNASGVSWGGTGMSPHVDIYPSDEIEFWPTDDIELSLMR